MNLPTAIDALRTAIPCPEGKAYLPYQLKGIRYMLGAPGSLLADEMGLGKTIQAIGVINTLAASMGTLRVLIVAPAGLLHNWDAELLQWLSPKTQAAIDILSYNGAQKQPDGHWDLLILDEAHYIKNADTKRAQAIKRLRMCCKRVIAITGTPIENCPVELWPLVQLVAPEYWDPSTKRIGVVTQEQKKSHPGEGPNFWEFAKRYCDLKQVSRKITHRNGAVSFKKEWDFSGASNLIELQARLRNTCMVRRMKQDVLTELPPKRRAVVLLKTDTTYDDSDLLPGLTYENYEETVRRLTAEKTTLETWSKRRHEQGLAMVDEIIPHVEEALCQSQKRILFCHHQDVAEAYHARFQAMGLQPVVVTGSTHVAERGAAVHSFQNDTAVRIFIGSIGAAGVGLTLTSANGVDFAELSPVPGQMTQAEDRAHRIGQKDCVMVRLFVADGTLSARIARILVRKQEVLSAALDTYGLEPEERGR